MSNDILPPSYASAVPPGSSLVARLTNIFVAPGEVFAEIKPRPINHANWLVAGLIFLLASWSIGALIFSQESIRHQMVEIQEQAMQKQFQKQIDAGKMTQAQVDQFKAGAAQYGWVGQAFVFGIAPLIEAVKFPFIGGFILWVGGACIFRRPFSYMKAVECVGMVLVISALGVLVKGLLIAAMGNMFASPGPILLVKNYDPTNQWHNLLAVLDVFLVWGLIVKSVALAKLADISFAKAAAWVIGVSLSITGGMFAMSWAAQHLIASLTGQGR